MVDSKPLCWIDMGNLGELVNPSDNGCTWQDHGMGLLRTIQHRAGIYTDMLSVRNSISWEDFYDKLLRLSPNRIAMNCRSYTFGIGQIVAKMFKKINPNGTVFVGGMHATVDPSEMLNSTDFDYICQGGGEEIICELTEHPERFQRLTVAKGAKSMADWPAIDRTLWPTHHPLCKLPNHWPLEANIGWHRDPGPVVTMVTSRVCPYKCSFCSEASYINNMERKPVDTVIDELNRLDDYYGPIGSVIIHDSLFMQQPRWLEEWIEKYPKRANRLWPYWAATRADLIRKWPDLFRRLVKETNWNVISVGFESGSPRSLKMLLKECTIYDNLFAINEINRLGDEAEAKGHPDPPKAFANLMIGIPGETPEDAFETARMSMLMKRKIVPLAMYSPYPGSVLGHQLIAEGKSLVDVNSRNRYPGQVHMKGLDRQFYNEFLTGRYDNEIRRKPWIALREPEGQIAEKKPEQMWLFNTKDGKKKLAYGTDQADALAVLSQRLSSDEFDNVELDNPESISQRTFRKSIPLLG